MRIGILFLTFVLVVSGCGLYIHISDIEGKPQKYQDKQVAIQGRVVEILAIPFVQKGVFQVDDGTGKIWVVSQKRVPFRGDEVAVKGKIETGFTIRERTFGIVIVEEE